MSIKTKLFLAAALTIAAVLGYGVWSDEHQRRLGELLGRVLTYQVRAMRTASELKQAFVLYDDIMLRYMLTGDSSLVDEGRRARETATERINAMGKVSGSATVGSLLQKLERESRLYFADVDRMIEFYRKYQFPEGGAIETVAVWSKQFPQHKQALGLLSSAGQKRLDRIYEACDKVLEINRFELESAQDRVGEMLEVGSRAAGGAALAVFGATVLVTLLLAFSILRPLSGLVRGVRQIMAGDLNVEIPITSGDEIGHLTQAFNAMTRNLREKQDQLVRETITDGLTGLYNFRYFKEVINRETQRAKRHERPLALLIVDVDHFKHYNDTNGHEMGNVVLKMAAQILKESLRGEDTVARYGGEEFVVLLVDTGKDQGLATAERLRRAISGTPFPAGEKQPLGRISVSIGGAEYPDDSQTSQALIEKADRSLYEAKTQGRDRVAWALREEDKAARL